MELLTQLRDRITTRAPAIQCAPREASRAMAQFDAMIETTDSRPEPNPDMLVISELEHIVAKLFHRLIVLRERDVRYLEPCEIYGANSPTRQRGHQSTW